MKKIKKFIKENFVYWIILIVVAIVANYRLPYYISAGGGTININNRISLSSGESNINGSLNMLYVKEYEATIPTYLMSYVFKDWKVEKLSDMQVSDETQEEINVRNKLMLDNSIQNAIFVAYNNAKKEISITGSSNYVIATTVDNGMKIGDKITKVNGKSVENISDIKEIIGECEVGDKVKFTIVRDDKEKEVECEVKEEDGNKIIGVVIITNYEYSLEPDVDIKFKKSESGSSGGLMMALTIYDVVSGEDIVKGRKIAGTGTIDIDGNVGEIDGIKYKLMGAVKNNVDIVLVPEANYKEAMKVKKEKGYKIEIVSVKTFEDAITYLRGN